MTQPPHIFADGFDQVTEPSRLYLRRKWDGNWDNFDYNSGGTPSGRFGGVAASLERGNLFKNMSTHQKWIAQFAVRFATQGNNYLCSWHFGPGGNFGQCALYRTMSGAVLIRRWEGPTVVTSADGVLLGGNVWNYIKVLITVGTPTGTEAVDLDVGEAKVHVNGPLRINATAINTWGYTGHVKAKTFVIHGDNIFDDVIAFNANAPAPFNTFVPEGKIVTSFPTGDGTYTEMTRVGGSAAGNYTAVDESQINADTDYVEADLNEKDTYTIQPLPAGVSSVLAGFLNAVSKKDDAGDVEITPLLRSSTTDSYGDARALGADYYVFQEPYLVNPHTSNPFSVSEANAVEIGQKRTV